LATVKDLEERLRRTENSISKAKGALWVLSGVLVIVAGLAGWALHEINKLDVEVAGIHTLLTNKLPEISMLRMSTNGSEAAKAYATTKDLLHEAKKSPNGLKPETVSTVSAALAQQGTSHGDLPEYWQLASFVIDQKSDMKGPSTTDCLSATFAKEDLHEYVDQKTGKIIGTEILKKDPNETIGDYTFALSDCTLNLDSHDFWHTGIGTKVAYELTQYPEGVRVNFDLTRVRVTYHGGKVIPFSSIRFTNCSFDFDLHAPPPPEGQNVGIRLLQADLQKPFSIVQPEVRSPNG
jgi:hypothetical protein